AGPADARRSGSRAGRRPPPGGDCPGPPAASGRCPPRRAAAGRRGRSEPRRPVTGRRVRRRSWGGRSPAWTGTFPEPGAAVKPELPAAAAEPAPALAELRHQLLDRDLGRLLRRRGRHCGRRDRLACSANPEPEAVLPLTAGAAEPAHRLHEDGAERTELVLAGPGKRSEASGAAFTGGLFPLPCSRPGPLEDHATTPFPLPAITAELQAAGRPCRDGDPRS